MMPSTLRWYLIIFWWWLRHWSGERVLTCRLSNLLILQALRFSIVESNMCLFCSRKSVYFLFSYTVHSDLLNLRILCGLFPCVFSIFEAFSQFSWQSAIEGERLGTGRAELAALGSVCCISVGFIILDPWSIEVLLIINIVVDCLNERLYDHLVFPLPAHQLHRKTPEKHVIIGL